MTNAEPADNEFEAYATQLKNDDPFITSIHNLGDDTCAIVKGLLFHFTIQRAVIGDEEGYFDRWCYENQQMADQAIIEWRARNYEGEPTGWHRHPMTGRRRKNGDPATEYVNR